MQRREFINTGFLTLGGMLIGRNFTYANALAETSALFQDINGNTTYDLIINGAGLSGFFTALEAAKRNLKVLVVDKRTSPGYDIAGKRKLWLQADGIEEWDEALLDLFFPAGEQEEMFNKELLGAPRNSRAEDELLLFAGSLKKGMLRSLLVNKVDVLLMTDVCGVVSDKNNQVSGIVVASKHGVYSINCGSFIDATDHNMFTRDLFRQDYKIQDASFVIELEGVGTLSEKNLFVSDSLGLLNNRIDIHKGKKAADQYLLEYSFPVEKNDLSAIEQKARTIAFEIGKNLPGLSPSFSAATLRFYALECSLHVAGKMDTSIPLTDYHYFENQANGYSCHSMMQVMEAAKEQVNKIHECKNQRDHIFVHYMGKKVPFKGSKKTINEYGQALPLSPFPVETLKPQVQDCSILIAGGGTAGTMAALGAARKGFQPTVVEYFNDMGGTRTMAGVYRYYRGLQDHEFMKQHISEVKQIAAEYHMNGIMPMCCQYLKTLLDNNCHVINGAIFCGAEVVNKQLKSITVCENGQLRKLNAQITIDATGDADVAYFAGEGFETGDSRMEITQNYSGWDVPFRPKENNYHRDYDIIDSTEISEMQRGYYLAHYESHYYDFYPMIGIRESRRPNGTHKLDMRDILKEKYFEDTIAQARSDFDAHYFIGAEYARCAFFCTHFNNHAIVNIPYRSIVPKTIDGLLFSGKAISESYGAIQFTRMAADVTVLGYVTGLIAAGIVKQGVRPRDFSVSAIREELKGNSYLPGNQSTDKAETIPQMVDKLTEGDATYLSRCCMEEKASILTLLENAFSQNRTILLAKALAWFGKAGGVSLIIKELTELFEEEQRTGHSSAYYEWYKTETLYWKINQDIALLGMAGSKESIRIINHILKHTTSGGKRVAGTKVYDIERIDYQLVPCFNRIFNLCFCIERIPDKIFISGLDQLFEDPHLGGYKSNEYQQVRWRVYGANLEVYMAAADARSGSKKGVERLIDYLTDAHSVFRHFAHDELVAIFHKDLEYDTHRWSQYANQKIRISYNPTPLIKETEV